MTRDHYGLAGLSLAPWEQPCAEDAATAAEERDARDGRPGRGAGAVGARRTEGSVSAPTQRPTAPADAPACCPGPCVHVAATVAAPRDRVAEGLALHARIADARRTIDEALPALVALTREMSSAEITALTTAVERR